jgi:gliding motility-associated lipoprotein GldD
MRNLETGYFTAGLAVWAVALTVALSGCSGDPVPRPRGFFRIDLPEKNYITYTSTCPFSLEVPSYAKIELNRTDGPTDSCWFNVAFPKFRARIHCTYLPITNNSDALVRDAYTFAAKHEMKASAIRRTLVEDPERSVFGVIYDIEGDAASQVQFFLMDSTDHFLRGALYFDHTPNADSIAPVLSFIREDIVRMTRSLQWTR